MHDLLLKHEHKTENKKGLRVTNITDISNITSIN